MLGRKLHWATSKSPVEQIIEAVVGDGFTVNREAGRLFHGWHTLQDLKDTEANARKRKWRAGAERFGMAIIGGVLLVVPVVIMSLNTSRTKSLITLSASVLVFAFVVAGGADEASPQEVIGATAAYAAVLAVFLGASAGSPTGT
jgi:VIT1/CCC1 family predicted Fe2+/Mn2+ transporter